MFSVRRKILVCLVTWMILSTLGSADTLLLGNIFSTRKNPAGGTLAKIVGTNPQGPACKMIALLERNLARARANSQVLARARAAAREKTSAYVNWPASIAEPDTHAEINVEESDGPTAETFAFNHLINGERLGSQCSASFVVFREGSEQQFLHDENKWMLSGQTAQTLYTLMLFVGAKSSATDVLHCFSQAGEEGLLPEAHHARCEIRHLALSTDQMMPEN